MHQTWTAAAAVGLLLTVSGARADEGQWMPEQVKTLSVQLAKAGLSVPVEQLWSKKPDAVMRAVVNLRGCSAGFISKDGLVATNHHCAYRALQEASSVDEDLLTGGFYAKQRSEERAAPGLTVKIVEDIREVTDVMRAVIDAEKDPKIRAEAAERKQKELVAECEKKGDVRCQVAAFYLGARYQLIVYKELRDIRLVYAPPTAVGNFGGEIDNWMWPRHSADFTLVRAYVAPDGSPANFDNANVPYHPRAFLPPSKEGVTDGDFVATIGYPGHTDRYLSAVEVERQLTQVFPQLITLYREWIDVQEKAAGDDKEKQLKISGRVRSLANREKNSRGMVDGIVRMGLLDKRKAEDATLADLAQKRGGRFGEVPVALKALSEKNRAAFQRDLSLRLTRYGADSLALALALTRWAREGKKPDLDRAAGYQDRDRDDLWVAIKRHLKTHDPDIDTALLASWQGHAQTIEGAPAAVGTFSPAKVAQSRIMTEAKARSLLEARDEAALAKEGDPALALAAALAPWVEQAEGEERARTGEQLALGPAYFELLQEVREGPVYPDANGTLRFSYATVRGYAPRDGLFATPQTTVAGLIAKHTGEAPFNLPAAVREKAAGAPETFWADPGLGDVPVCFLSSSDTTGGNSGSPVINHKGELVGLNFDRVWVNIAGDFGYDISRSRNVTVDFRYVLWLLDEVQGDRRVLGELGLAAYADRPARRDRPKKRASRPGDGGGVKKKPWGCAQTRADAAGWLGVAVVLGFGRRRKKQWT